VNGGRDGSYPVVEDEPQVLILAEEMLKEAGHETLSASNYQDAHALLTDGNLPDLLFVDHNLGKGPSGIDLARTARNYRADMAVIYTSGDLLTDGVKALFVEGAEFLAKPYTPEELRSSVARLLDGAADKSEKYPGRDSVRFGQGAIRSILRPCGDRPSASTTCSICSSNRFVGTKRTTTRRTTLSGPERTATGFRSRWADPVPGGAALRCYLHAAQNAHRTQG
jgi:CheY-like chemotaxis protein